MKISYVLGYMGLEYNLRGDRDYDPQIDINDLDLECANKPSNYEFHVVASLALNQQMIKNYSSKLQNKINEKAQEKSYEDGFACASYINSTNDAWKAEATQFIAWRDSCWQYAHDIQTKVESGEIQPPSIEDFIAGMPTLIWS